MKTQKSEIAISDMDLLKSIVEEEFGHKILANNRTRDVVDSRIIFSKIIRERGHTFKSIGNYLYKDHSTIIHYEQQASNLIRIDKKTMEMYIRCRNRFEEHRTPVILHTDRDLIKEILSLRGQMDELLLQYEDIKKVEEKYKRLEPIINLIENRTPHGKENLIKRKINEMFNGV